MIPTDLQVDSDVKENEEDDVWWELWEQRRRMAVVLVLCHVVHALHLLTSHYDLEHFEESDMSRKERKRKVRKWEKKFRSIKKSINDVAEAINEGNVIAKRARQRVHVHSDREIYAELVKIGVERNIRRTAYDFLIQYPSRVRAFFGCSVNERKNFLLHIMKGSQMSEPIMNSREN